MLLPKGDYMETRKKYSILHPNVESAEYKQISKIACHDLALDMLCKSVGGNDRESGMIMDVISKMTADPSVAEYRSKVFCDILRFPKFRERMVELFDRFEFMRSFGSNRLKIDEKTGIWHLLRRLDELNDYIVCVEAMQECLSEISLESQGLRGLKKHIDEIYRDANFGEMKADIAALKIDSSEVRSLTVGINVNDKFEATGMGLISINNKPFKKSGIVSAFADAVSSKDKIHEGTDWSGDMHYRPLESAPDFDDTITSLLMEKSRIASKITNDETIARIADGDVLANSTFYLSHIAGKMLDTLIRKLRDTLSKYADIVIFSIAEIIPEFVYYIRFAEFVEKYKSLGYSFCEAKVTDKDGTYMEARDFYNLKLAISGVENKDIVTNDLDFDKEHTVYILTGANRGGKTTVTQAVGLMQVLAQGGIFVPARSFDYKPVDCIYTHFPADEDKTLDLGRLGEECVRFKESFKSCTKKSLCLLNESFSTTSFEEGYYIAKDSVKALLKKSVRTIYNTHMHKLGDDIEEFNLENPDAKASSLVVQSEGGERSFRIKVAPPEGMSYARDIAEKYGVTYEMLTRGI